MNIIPSTHSKLFNESNNFKYSQPVPSLMGEVLPPVIDKIFFIFKTLKLIIVDTI